MAKTLEQIKADVMALPIGERIDLAQDSFAASTVSPKSKSAWLEEIKRRVALSDAGQVDEVDAEDLDAQIRARYQWDGNAEVD